jgi:P-type E1-E2 ATPase
MGSAPTQPLAAGASATGLSEAEARRRLPERAAPARTGASRSYGSIVRANVFTLFNLILAAFGTVTLLYGDWRDALFLGILVANTAIGIVQEVRAKRALDRLSALVAPSANVVRDGRPRPLHVDEVVPGDLVRLAPGDQVVADGRLTEVEGLALDESILSGESAPLRRGAGDEVRSGSFAVEGRGSYVVEAVGVDSYAERIAGEARAFRHPRSPLERAFNSLLLGLVAVMLPLSAVLGVSLWRRDASLDETVSTSVAAVVSLVPEGLMVLASLTYAVAALRMSRRGALAQQLNAIESLAAADVICTDKTGTLTESALRVVSVLPAPGTAKEELAGALGRYASSSPARNATLEAVAHEFPAEPLSVEAEVPFSSGRRWSALGLDGRTYVLGAPELLPSGALADTIAEEQRRGRRVLAFAASSEAAADGSRPQLPERLELLGLLVLAERLRPEARATVEYFRAQGVELKVLSGDAPETVGAIAADAGIPARTEPVDGSAAADDPETLRAALDSAVVGRISPEGKRAVVAALRDQGRYVAMLGDGVNDVPALKAARLAIAQGSGAQMARAIADLVLVKGGFAAIPAMIREGRKVLRNLQRVAKLFVAKSALAAFLILTVGISSESYPFLPRHLTLASAITIGIPAFFLALAPSTGPWRPDRFLRELASFAIPAGTAAGLGVVASFLLSINLIDMSEVRARTVATTVLVAVGLYLIIVLEASSKIRGYTVGALCAALFALYLVVLSLPGWRDFFEVAAPDPAIILVSLVGTALAVTGLALTDERFLPLPDRRPPEPPGPPSGSAPA